MNKQSIQKKVVLWRTLIQWGFLVWVAFVGIRFGMFVRHFESGGAAPFISRPQV
jgi:hypothetical protein